MGRPDRAAECHAAALALARQTGDRVPEVTALVGLGIAGHATGRGDAADRCREALDAARQARYRVHECRAHAALAVILAGTDPDAAAEHAGAALSLARDTGCWLHPADAVGLRRAAAAAGRAVGPG
jgi:ribulose 1,5-bisphosphate carboxylase large subunit-like protein